jgi:hypothetical protein
MSTDDLHARCLNPDEPEQLTFVPGSHEADELGIAIEAALERLLFAEAEHRERNVAGEIVDELVERIMTQPKPVDRYEALRATLTWLLAGTSGVMMALRHREVRRSRARPQGSNN